MGVASTRITCPGETIAETDSEVSFPNAVNDGDCLGDGIRSDSKDPSKYIINKNSDGTLTYKSDGYPDLKMSKKALKVADNLSGSFEGSVPFIIDVTADFDGSGSKADVDVNVKVASTRITCPGETIAETDAQVTFPNAVNDGDCLGDGIRSDSKDPSKYIIVKNADGTLTYNSDGYPALKMTKKSLKATAVSGAYEGSVPFIIDVNMDFTSDSAVDADINVKVASVRVTCPGEVYSSDGSLITFPNAPTDGDCLGDGVRSDGKDASKYNLNINDDGTLTFNSDGYPALKL